MLIGVSIDQCVMTGSCDVKLFSNVTCGQWIVTRYHHNLINTNILPLTQLNLYYCSNLTCLVSNQA